VTINVRPSEDDRTDARCIPCSVQQHTTRAPFFFCLGNTLRLSQQDWTQSVTSQILQSITQTLDTWQLNKYTIILSDKYIAYLAVVGSYLQIVQ